MELNRPSRSDYYLMKIVSALLAEPPTRLEELKIEWEFPEESKKRRPRMTVEMATAFSKAKWFAISGYQGSGPMRIT